MNKTVMVIVALVVILVVLVGIGFGTFVSYSNKEIQLRNTFDNKVIDNQNEYDNMWKKIKQSAQVTDKERQSLLDVFVKYADARTTDSNNVMMNWIKESVPNVSPDLYKNLMNIITSSRDNWTMRQKELIDLKREHDNLRMMFPGSLFLAGRTELKLVIITSDRTKEAFKTGSDNDTDVF